MQNPPVGMAQARVSEAEGMQTQAGLIPTPHFMRPRRTPLSAALSPSPSATTRMITCI
jgi:hypothetical protein